MGAPIAKQHDVTCPDCGAAMRLRDSRHGLFYGCSRYPDCKGSHGAHPDGKPLGTPGDATTKKARIEAHAAFDQLWKPINARMTRTEAYLWMQSALGIKSSEAHIGGFDQGRCAALVAKVKDHLSRENA